MALNLKRLFNQADNKSLCLIHFASPFSGRSARLAFVCKIPLLARALGTRPSARATIGYLVYKPRVRKRVSNVQQVSARADLIVFGLIRQLFNISFLSMSEACLFTWKFLVVFVPLRKSFRFLPAPQGHTTLLSALSAPENMTLAL